MIGLTGFRGMRMRHTVPALIGAAVLCLATAAQAAPLAPGKGGVAATGHDIIQVRDGCGSGMRYSDRRDACVEDFDGGPRGYDDRGPPPPPPMYDRRPPPPPEYGYRAAPMPDCGRGMRFSNSRQACVPLEERVDNRGDSDVAAGALIGGAVGALIGSSIRNDAGPQRRIERQVR